MPTTTWAEAVAGQPATAAQYNNLIGIHPAALVYEGAACAAGNTATEASTFATNGAWVAQPFVLSGTEVRRLRLRLRITGSGIDVTVTLRADSAGSPATGVLATIVVPREFLTASARWIDLPLVATGLTNGATYWVVVSSGGNVTDRILVSAAGAVSPSVKTSTNGTSWSAGSTQLLYSAFSGSTGALICVAEDGGARWSELIYDTAGKLITSNEYVGTFRNARTLAYDSSGNLTGVS